LSDSSIWNVNISQYFSECHPGGIYTLTGIISKNKGNLKSAIFPDISFTVDNSSCLAAGNLVTIDRAFFSPDILTDEGQTKFVVKKLKKKKIY
jgi:hypothetical protein